VKTNSKLVAPFMFSGSLFPISLRSFFSQVQAWSRNILVYLTYNQRHHEARAWATAILSKMAPVFALRVSKLESGGNGFGSFDSAARTSAVFFLSNTDRERVLVFVFVLIRSYIR
jgi:hypothetical protein